MIDNPSNLLASGIDAMVTDAAIVRFHAREVAIAVLATETVLALRVFHAFHAPAVVLATIAHFAVFIPLA